MQIRSTRLRSGFSAGFEVRYVAAVVMLLAVAPTLPAAAADPIFPIGSRLGIVPPPGMVQSRNFVGFEDPEKNAAILFTTLPAQAYDSLDKTMVPEAMKKDGIDVEKREPVQLSFGNGFILSGAQATDKGRYRKWLVVAAGHNVTALVTAQVPDQDAAYPDKAMRDALTTLVMRDSVPDAEQLSLMPFTIGDMAGFRIDEVLPGRAIMLVDKPADAAQAKEQSPNKDAEAQGNDAPTLNARLFIAAMPGGPAEPSDRSNFARTTFQQIVGIKDVQIQDAEPLRIGGQQGFETLAKAKDAKSDTEVMAVQWLRFGTTGFLQMIGIARADTWLTTFTRLRAIRDSIDPK